MSEVTAPASGQRRWVALVAVGVLLPLLAALVLVWSTDDRAAELSNVPVAIVNNDVIITDPQPMAAGRALTASLTNPDDGSETLDWTLTEADDAKDGLRSGAYYAVLTIPADFSKTILSTGTDAPESGQLTLKSNAAASETVPYISKQVVSAAAQALGLQSTQGYLKQVYSGFNQIASGQQNAADSATQLAGGTQELAQGADQMDAGANTLAGSLDEVATGASSLKAGTASVSSGAARLQQGTADLASGLGRLDGATSDLAGGAGRLAARAGGYADRSAGAARAASTVAVGASRLATFADRVAGEIEALSADCLSSGGSVSFCASLRETRARARAVAAGSRVLARGTGGVARATSALGDGARALAAADRALAAGARGVDAATGRVGDSAALLARGAADLASGAAGVDAATGQLVGGTAQTSAAAGQLASGSDTLDSSASQVNDGAQQLSSGLTKGAEQSPTYTKSQQDTLATVVSQPVQLTSTTEHDTHANGRLIGTILGLVLWLAALVGASLLNVSASRRYALSPVSSRRIAILQIRPVLGLALAQGAAVVVALLIGGASIVSAVSLALLSLLAAVSFSLIGYALRLAWGTTGITVFVLLLLLQIAALANVLPIETAPAPLQTLNGLLPLTAFVNGASQLISGGQVGSPVASVVVLVVWGLAAFVSTLTAVKRKRMIGTLAVRPAAAGGTA